MSLKDRLAVCSWSLQPSDCDDLIEKVKACGLSRVQLALNPIAERKAGWENAPEALKAARIEVVSGMVGTVGEDYTTIASIERTGGVVPDETWPQTREVMQKAAKVAGEMRLPLVTFHAGFIPHDPSDPAFEKVASRVSEVVDLFAAAGTKVALETGQEPAEALESFLGRNEPLGVNFDPANMLLYASGDPIDALRRLLRNVIQVHLKDANPSDMKGEWGTEVPVGQGSVDWPAFFRTLDQGGYRGDLVIEREAGNNRVADVRTAVAFVTQTLAPDRAK